MKDLSCFHCHETVPEDFSATLKWDNEPRHFCCAGCLAVAEAIIDNGLDDYYKFRTDSADRAQALIPEQLQELNVLDDAIIQQDFVASQDTNKTAELGIEGISCAACSWLIETRLQKESGVHRVQVNPITHRLQLSWDSQQVKLSELLTILLKLGYRTFPFQQNHFETQLRKENRNYLMRLGVAGLGMMQVMMFAIGLYIGDDQDITRSQQFFLHWISGLIALPIVLYSAFPFFRNAYYGLKARHLVMDVPVVIAITVAFVASIVATVNEQGTVYFDSVSMFIFFLLLGRFLEHRVRVKSVMATQTQRQLLPLSVTLKTPSGEKAVPLYQVQVGDQVLVASGHTFPIDGDIVEGSTTVNESMLSGESTGVAKNIGDKVLAGSINDAQTVTVKATAIGEATYLSALQRMTHQAALSRPAVAKLTDKVAHYFVFAILLIVSIVYLTWLSLDPDSAFWIALSVLVVSCPCALSLATPTALTTASHHLSRSGLLILKPDALPNLEKITLAAFDKTGTLTDGQLVLKTIDVLDPNYPSELLRNIAASLELHQTHPVAQALQRESFAQLPFTQVEQVRGKGIQGFFNGHCFRIGSAEFCSSASSSTDAENLATTTNCNHDVCDIDVYISCDNQLIARLWFSDRLKPNTEQLFNQLAALNIKTVILSGDKNQRVNAIAQAVHAEAAFGQQSPQDKADYIKAQQNQGDVVLMVGDGINDSLVLAQADVGIAVDSAADITQVNADAVLTTHDIGQLLTMKQLADKTQTVIRQNLTWALAYNITAIPFAAVGWVPPWLAAIGMTGSSIIVVLNALRLRYKND